MLVAGKHVQPGRQLRDVRAELRGGEEPVDVGQEIVDPALGTPAFGHDVGERPEAGTDVDGDGAQLEVAGENRARGECASRLADAAGRAHEGDDVRLGHAWMREQPCLELRLFALRARDGQPSGAPSSARERSLPGREPIDESAARALVHRRRSRAPV